MERMLAEDDSDSSYSDSDSEFEKSMASQIQTKADARLKWQGDEAPAPQWYQPWEPRDEPEAIYTRKVP